MSAVKRPRIWLELLIVVWLCWIYDDINNLSPLRRAAAMGHARWFLHLEQTLHLDPEAALDHWLAGHSTLGWLAGNYYDNIHFIVTLGLLGLLWWRYPVLYRPLRNGLVLTNLGAMALFWAFPTAPPRLLDPSVYIDVVAHSDSFGSWHSGTLGTAANQLAAFPSLHIGWAAWSALVAWRILARRRGAWLVWAYPVVTAVVVMATGNHFLIDVVSGAVVLAGAQLCADRWTQRWSARWTGWWAARWAGCWADRWAGWWSARWARWWAARQARRVLVLPSTPRDGDRPGAGIGGPEEGPEQEEVQESGAWPSGQP